MQKVEFTSNYSSFKSGEVVALENNKAKGYIALGIAKFHSECEAAPEKPLEVKEDAPETVTEIKPKKKSNKK